MGLSLYLWPRTLNVCTFTNVYAVHFHDIYFMPLFFCFSRLQHFTKYFSIPFARARTHNHMHALLFFVSVGDLSVCVYLPGLYWKCNYRDFRRKMGENREMEEEEERHEHCKQIITIIEKKWHAKKNMCAHVFSLLWDERDWNEWMDGKTKWQRMEKIAV